MARCAWMWNRTCSWVSHLMSLIVWPVADGFGPPLWAGPVRMNVAITMTTIASTTTPPTARLTGRTHSGGPTRRAGCRRLVGATGGGADRRFLLMEGLKSTGVRRRGCRGGGVRDERAVFHDGDRAGGADPSARAVAGG